MGKNATQHLITYLEQINIILGTPVDWWEMENEERKQRAFQVKELVHQVSESSFSARGVALSRTHNEPGAPYGSFVEMPVVSYRSDRERLLTESSGSLPT